MQVNHVNRNGIDIIELSGRMVKAHSADLRAKIIALVNAGPGQVIFDMRGVTFIDASGLSVLVSAMKAVKAINGRIALSGIQANVQYLLELTRLHYIFEIFVTLEAATASLNPP